MEYWLLFGILAYVFHGISSAIDKYFMKKEHRPIAIDMFKMFFNSVTILLVGLFFFDIEITLKLFLWSLPLGALYAVAGIIYFTALESKDVEVVVPYVQSLTIILVTIVSVFLFKEVLNIYNISGVIAILAGIYVVLSKDGFKVPEPDDTLLIMLILVAAVSTNILMVKKLLLSFEPVDLAVMMYFSAALILFFYEIITKKEHGVFDWKGPRIAISALFAGTGTLFLYLALAIGEASRVYPIAGLQSVTVFVFATLFLGERFEWHRLMGMLIVFLGIFLISL